MTTTNAPREGFFDRLCALRDAIDQVQPLADYRDNFAALHAVCALDEAIAAVLTDIAPFVDHARLIAAINAEFVRNGEGARR